MTLSIWRYSHLALAVSSFIFITLAALTGIVLAFEPVSQKIKPYRVENFKSITLAETLPALQKNYVEVIELRVDANDFVSVNAINAAGKKVEVYINPKTGEYSSDVPPKNEFFDWVKTLHRSLFLHNAGRIFIGINSWLLFLIALSGTLLLINRQRGIKGVFKKIVKESPAQYFHVVVGRLSLIPILIISLTGVFLCLVKLDYFPAEKIKHKIDFDAIKTSPGKKINEFDCFKTIKLTEVETLEFPFSEDAEDYFTLKLEDRELVLNQFTGEILSEVPYAKQTLFANWSLDLHTGRSSGIWAVVLAVASVNILFFIYSGFTITLKRRKSRIKNRYSKEESEYIILVGSENGSTFHFADVLHRHLIKHGKKSHISELNAYTNYPKAKHLVFMTATYGVGDAPTNANHVLKRLKETLQNHAMHFSVLGFGSRSYPDFCQFAFELYDDLLKQKWANALLDIATVNDKSPQEFLEWTNLFLQKANIPESIAPALLQNTSQATQTFKVLSKNRNEKGSSTFLLSLKSNRFANFTSGDLLAVYPANDHRERLYSIGKVNGSLQLSVRLHENGLGSEYLNTLQAGQTIKARLVSNPDFHFPKKTTEVLLISNGTGIAPFLGMIDQNKKRIVTHLYCGFREASSFDLYKAEVVQNLQSKKLSTLQVAYSREGKKHYVKDLLSEERDFIANLLHTGGHIMICGSLAMQKNVLEVLQEICNQQSEKLEHYQAKGQILMDCY